MRFSKLINTKSDLEVVHEKVQINALHHQAKAGPLLTDTALELKIYKSKIQHYINELSPYLLLLLFFITLYHINAVYLEINQPCPFNNGFDCYYRYLLCENDCDLSKPIHRVEWIDFGVGPRSDELMLDTKLAGMIKKLVMLAAIYAFILTFAIFHKKFRFFVIIVVANFLVLRFYRDGKAAGDYSKVFSYWLIVLACIFTTISVLTVISVRISSKGRAYASAVFACTILFGVVIPAYTVVNRYTTSCANWDLGLYGERIDNTVNCMFDKPSFCLYEFLGDFFDRNLWVRLTNEDREPHWEYIREKYPNASRIGFPNLIHASKEERRFGNVTNYVYSHLSVVDETNEKNFEVILNRTPDPEKDGLLAGPAYFDINIRFNEWLVAQRSKLVSDSIANNVMVIYIDTMSRAAAFRQLKETMKVFEGMSPKVHQFFKYHSISPYTLGNMYPMFYNLTRPFRPDVPPFKEFKSFIHDYKDKGFITGRALSHCALSALDSTYDADLYQYIDEEPFDHMANAWGCDPEFLARYKDDASTGPTSLLRRYVYGKDISEYVIEYGQKFWETYKNQKKFLWLDFLDFHDFTFSHGKYLDPHLSKFLKGIDLSDTLLLIISDHGQHIFRTAGLQNFQSALIEKAAPAFFAKLPFSAEPIYGENLEKNKNQIIQAFDIYGILTAIPNPDRAPNSLLYPLQNKTKGCDFIWDQNCHCKLKNDTKQPQPFNYTG